MGPGSQLAGVPGGLVFHSVRHTIASRLVIDDVDLTAVGRILGNPRAVQRYAHLSEEHKKKAVKALDPAPVGHTYAARGLNVPVENAG